ncbi:MAG: hypothetical protein IPP96_07215 [Chitinophagaceae bacterium]|nr:hypothetical protein [Chitinophagaceae bacterium]
MHKVDATGFSLEDEEISRMQIKRRKIRRTVPETVTNDENELTRFLPKYR